MKIYCLNLKFGIEIFYLNLKLVGIWFFKSGEFRLEGKLHKILKNWGDLNLRIKPIRVLTSKWYKIRVYEKSRLKSSPVISWFFGNDFSFFSLFNSSNFGNEENSKKVTLCFRKECATELQINYSEVKELFVDI